MLKVQFEVENAQEFIEYAKCQEGITSVKDVSNDGPLGKLGNQLGWGDEVIVEGEKEAVLALLEENGYDESEIAPNGAVQLL